MSFGTLYSTETNKTFPLNKSLFTFGRDKKCDFTFVPRCISSHHCHINITDDGVLITDTSLNGTFINNKRIGNGNTATLSPNETFRLASNVSFTFISPPSSTSSDDTDDTDGDQPADSLFALSYECGRLLGSGAFAEVRMCTHRETGKNYAAKVVDKIKFAINCPSVRKASYLDEITILKSIRHPYIVSVEDVFETSRYLTIILQYVEGGDLFDKIIEVRRFSEPDAKIIFKQMVDGLMYLHDNNIAHRDLKPENYLVLSRESNVHIVMADFGLAKVYQNDDAMITMCGTPQYLAPELMAQMLNKKVTGYTKAVDMWALGVILFVLLVGYPPFGPKDFENIMTARYDFSHSLWKTVSSHAKKLVSALLTHSPVDRMTVHQAAAHDWLVDVIVPPLVNESL